MIWTPELCQNTMTIKNYQKNFLVKFPNNKVKMLNIMNFQIEGKNVKALRVVVTRESIHLGQTKISIYNKGKIQRYADRIILLQMKLPVLEHTAPFPLLTIKNSKKIQLKIILQIRINFMKITQEQYLGNYLRKILFIIKTPGK